MDFEREFPLRLLINLGRREDRRFRCEEMFAKHGIEVERFAAVDQRRVRRARGYQNSGRYALAVTQRLAIRRARQLGAEAVLLFEDDVLLHPQFQEAVERLELPSDWGIFYFGCAHTSRPLPVTPGVVQTVFALDTHAIAIRRPYYHRVMAALKGIPGKDQGDVAASDWLLAQLHAEIPAYAAFPNLAWQAASKSDLLHCYCTNYTGTGSQRHSHYAVRGLAAEMLGGQAFPEMPATAAYEPGPAEPPVNPAFLFLTIGDLHHPRIWEEYFPTTGYGVYCHPKHPQSVATPWLKDGIVNEHHPTWWGSVSLVRATLALLKEALADERHTHFILLSESCVPVKPFHHLRKTLETDPRSIAWNTPREEVAKHHFRKAERFDTTRQVPGDCARFQSQWMILSREAAELVTADDFTHDFEAMFAPDECYFMTVLAMKGYPVETAVRCMDSTWNRWSAGSPHPETHSEITREFAAELLASPSLFGRKFAADSNIGDFGLHLPPR